MAVINVVNNGDIFYFEKAPDELLVNVLSHKYHSALPFPHIIIDNFLPDFFLDKILTLYPNKNQSSAYHTSSHQRFKHGFRPDNLGTNPCRSYLYLFNTQPFLELLEDLTGINGLIPDPYFHGAGFHEIEPSGKLNIHTDFNYYKKLNLIRRVNVLIYLNHDWMPEYGGQLELWDKEVQRCEKSIEPIFNRCVIFNTDKQSFHGHPDPLTCPETMSRKSIALYYYTTFEATIDETKASDKTDWKKRPGTDDQISIKKTSFYKRVIRRLKGK